MSAQLKLSERISKLEEEYLSLKNSLKESSTEKIKETEEPKNESVSLFQVLVKSDSSLSTCKKESDIIKTYLKYVDDFLDTHIIETTDEIKIDYRIIALTLEFITAAKKDICSLSGVKSLDISIVCTTCVWFLNVYKQNTSTTRLSIPSNIEVLIKTMYDIRKDKYIFDLDEPQKNVEKKKIKKTFISRSRIRFSTIANRWINRPDPGCIPY